MFAEQTWLARMIWLSLAGVVLWALVQLRFELAFVAMATLALSLAPLLVANWAKNVAPSSLGP